MRKGEGEGERGCGGRGEVRDVWSVRSEEGRGRGRGREGR